MVSGLLTLLDLSTICRQLGSFLGETMAKYFDSAAYGSSDARRAQESKDAGMIPSSRGIANMPQGVVMRAWPSEPYGAPEGLNDQISGIDRQMKDDNKRKKPINSEKF